MAVRNGNRYVPPLRASPVTPEQRKWMAMGAANALELEGTVSPERSFAVALDTAAIVAQAQALSADTQTRIWRPASVGLDLAVCVTRPLNLAADTSVRPSAAIATEFDAAVRVSGFRTFNVDLLQDVGHPVRLSAEATLCIYAVLRREDHLILT